MKEKYYFVMHGLNIFLYWLTVVVVVVVVVLVLMVLRSNVGIVYTQCILF